MDEKARKYDSNPIDQAGIVSKTFILFISRLLNLGKKRPLRDSDLPDVSPHDESRFLTEQLEKEWSQEKDKPSPSFARCFMRIYWLDLFCFGLLLLFEEMIKLVTPFLLLKVLKYFDGQIDLKECLLYALLICVGVIINCIIHHPFFLKMQQIGVRARIALMGLVYKKISKLSSSSLQAESHGKLINLLSKDCDNVEGSFHFLPFLIVSPLELVIVVFIIINTMDVTFLSGCVVIFIALPTQAVLAKLFDKMRRISSKKCDRRINMLSEIFKGVKVIKMYCWEEPFKQMIQFLRKKELNYQRYVFMVIGLNHIIQQTMTHAITFVCVTVFVTFSSSPFLPSYLVLILSLYLSLATALVVYIPLVVTGLVSASVSISRIKEFLVKEEVEETNERVNIDNPSISVKDLNCSWSKDKNDFSLRNISLEVKRGELVGIVGPVGSGKTSILLALLEELNIKSGQLSVNGRVFYVPQEPWVFTATIRQNILFGRPYEAEKFRQVVQICCLDQDLKSFPSAELTIIGDKGVNLSGGQRARINLARALYSESDIYLLDDPLSAVDAGVVKDIYNNCISGYLSKHIRVLVTHQVHLLRNVDKLVCVDNGEIVFMGTFEEFATRKELHHMMDSTMVSNQEAISRSNLASSESSLDSEASEQSECQMDKIKDSENQFEEKHLTGGLSWATFLKYMRQGGGVIGALVVFAFYSSFQFFSVFADYWLSIWATEEAIYFKQSNQTLCFNCSTTSVLPRRFEYYKFYCVILACFLSFAGLKVSLFFFLALRASKKLHHEMFNNVLCSFIRFFDINPLGRIINRFSKDIGALDEAIPTTALTFLRIMFIVSGTICLSAFINKWILVSLAPLGFILAYIRKYYMASSTEVKRIEGINRSPVFVHLNNSISGLVIVKAAKMWPILIDEFFACVNDHTRSSTTFMYISRWFGCRLDWIAGVYTVVTLLACIFLKERLSVNSAQVGIMLVYLIRLVGLFQYWVKQSCELENLMVSVERITEYVNLSSENLNKGEKIPLDDTWPNKGAIVFEDVSFRYHDSLPPVLRHLSFRVEPGEKIAIVGRTGAGKSSIIQALFRMAESDGRIIIDGVNIKQISLHDLRSKLSIIPQEPVLFGGTIRSNLDPFNKFNDSVLWTALERVQMNHVVKEMREGLNSEVLKEGANLSLGQKQLICLARALIKQSKILVIDEATANVDFKTDGLIQKAIRECFRDCTVLTIAHRLHTIIDCDRIMCLNSGQIESFASPYELLTNNKSIFYKLFSNIEASERNVLFQIAKENYSKIKPPISTKDIQDKDIDVAENEPLLSKSC